MASERTNARPALVGIGVLAVLILAYSLLILQEVLLGVAVAGGLVGGALLVWLAVRAVRALERIADSVENGDGGDHAVESGADGRRGSERAEGDG